MHDLKHLLTSLSLFFFLGNVQARCLIDLIHLKSNNLYLSNHNGVYDIQRTDIVEIGHSVHLLCKGGQISPAFECKSNSVFSPALSSDACVPPDPVVEVVPDTSCSTPSSMYRVGFSFNGRFMELYRNCYDANSLALQHSIYKTYRFINNADRPNPKWASDDISFEFDNSYLRDVIKERLSRILNPIQAPSKFDKGHMTPASGVIFRWLKVATFRYLNCIPQHEAVNRGKWKAIETWLNKMVKGTFDTHHRTYDVLKVCAGALEVHEVMNKKIYLLTNNNKIPVPKWMYQIVSHLSGDKWVMLTYNDLSVPTQQEVNQICQVIPCHSNLSFTPTNAGQTVCCNPYPFITNNAPHLTGVC
ncbi:uncharacterized protein LOC122621353 [Drosophila teissieri]|uniref:uncharacterized protein LOC122621353 n=1 Tax=Drosophila teissieri TaxID=7243 RepID=UPI001CBA43C9|nr:uncharacterized protein LOC122621353 [Drosophila teissieri]